MKKISNLLLLFFAALILSGCGLWGDSGAEIEPSELVAFSPEKKVIRKWSVSIGASFGKEYQQFTPAIDGDSIFVVDKEGLVSSFALSNGANKWRVDLNTKIVGGVGAGLGKVAVTSAEGEAILLAAEDGTELWRSNLGAEVVSAGQFNLELAVFQLITGKVVAFDAATGERRWTFDIQIPRLTLRGTSTPVVAADATFAGFSNGKLVAINNENGATVWGVRVALPTGRSELERIIDIDGKPLLANNMLYVSSYQGRLAAIDPFRGRIAWAKKISSRHTLATGFGNIYVSESNDAVQAFDSSSSASVWRQTNLANRRITSPSVLDTTVVVADAQGYVHFMSQIDGHFVARYEVDSSGVYGDMLVKDDVLYILSNSGKLTALSLD